MTTATPLTFTTGQGPELSATLTTPKGYALTVSGALEDAVPEVSGSPHLSANKTLLTNLWSYGLFTKRYRRARAADKREMYERNARAHRKIAVRIGTLLDYGASTRKTAWCSACYTKSEHARLLLPAGSLPCYLCQACGSPTLTCLAPGCPHMASRGRSRAGVPRYCAQHRHEMPSFERSSDAITDLEEWKTLFEFESPNLQRIGTLATTSVLAAATLTPLALAAAPAIGGAVGTLIGGYAGAAAVNWGLAAIGGGAIASGGLGMAGGTMIITATGSALGAGLGMSVANAYVSDDKSFRIEKVQDGEGPAVLVANGFLTTGKDTWERWRHLLEAQYSSSPVYRVHWGAKELKNFGSMIGGQGGARAAMHAVGNAAKGASRAAAKKLGPLGAPLAAHSVATNPWTTARNRADRTGVALATILARTDSQDFTLVGHSLGARVMVRAAQALATYPARPTIRTMHLLGAAAPSKENWESLSHAVSGHVYNYHSRNDPILKWLYTAAELGQKPAGLVGFKGAMKNMDNRDLSTRVKDHGDYFETRLREEPPRYA